MNTQTNNEMKCPKNSIHACEEDHYGNCYFCGRSMLTIPQTPYVARHKPHYPQSTLYITT